MSDTGPDLDRLHEFPNAIPAKRDAMTIAVLDGYVVALIVCPEMVEPWSWRRLRTIMRRSWRSTGTAGIRCGNRGSTLSSRPCGCARMRGRKSR